MCRQVLRHANCSTASSMKSDNGLTCSELVELVTGYLEDALPQLEYARFARHLSGCRDCSTYLAQMRQTLDLLAALREEASPAVALHELLHMFRHWRRA